MIATGSKVYKNQHCVSNSSLCDKQAGENSLKITEAIVRNTANLRKNAIV